MGDESTYWAFSAAAQTVAAFVALLLAGYALVHSMMESAARSDESLLEIHEALKKRYYVVLSTLALTTAIAIVMCLLVVYFNDCSYRAKAPLTAAAALFTLLAVAGGVFFVLMMVDPRKYGRTAHRMARELRAAKATPGIPAARFFESFVELERVVRALYERHVQRLGIPHDEATRPSFRQMLDYLGRGGVIPETLKAALLTVSRHRNLIFHGQVSRVDPEVIGEVRTAGDALTKIE